MCELYPGPPLIYWRIQLRARRLLIVIIATALTALAQDRPPARPAAKPGLTDAALESAIRERFAKSKSAADKFTVRVQGGVATIEGSTDVLQRKGSATRMAKAAGARQVINKIQASDAARRKASASLAQGRRRAQVKRSEANRGGANR